MNRIVLVRHGETIWHAENRYAGCSDVPLSSRGLLQAAHLAAWARDAGLSAVWSSTLARAKCTAQPAADAASLPLRLDERLVELDFGRGEGLTEAEMEDRFPAERSAFVRDPILHHLPGGEDPKHAVERGIAALRDIISAAPGERSLVVAHNTLIRLVLCRLLNIPLSKYRIVFPQVATGTFAEVALASSPDGPTALLAFNAPLILGKGNCHHHE